MECVAGQAGGGVRGIPAAGCDKPDGGDRAGWAVTTNPGRVVMTGPRESSHRLILAIRPGVGNPYEEFFFAECVTFCFPMPP
jgi:hypothetical protein